MVSVAVPDPEKKRTRSLQTVESCGSSLSSSFQPRSKRTKMCNEDIVFQYFRLDLLPEPYMTRSNSPAPSACTYDPEKTTAEGSTVSPINSSYVDQSSGHFTESTVEISVADASGQRNELLRMVESPKMNPMDLDPSKSAQSSVPTSEQAFQLYKDEANELADHSKKRPSLEFGRQPSGMNSMPLQAAEYLFAVENKQRSFDIYRILQEADIHPHRLLSTASLACARASVTLEQRQHMKEYLLDRLKMTEGISPWNHFSASERSLTHLLLAQLCSIDGICAELELHLELSLAATEQSKPVDPSFDLLIYLLYKHSTERLSHLKSQECGAHVPIGTASHVKFVNCNDFVQFALGLRQLSMSTSNLISTPQEYPRIAVVSCVRSCIGWCAKSIDIDESLLRRQLDVT